MFALIKWIRTPNYTYIPCNIVLPTNRETLVTQLQLVQDTNTILEQWRSHYEREIVNLQLAKVEAEGVHRQDMSKKEEQIESVSYLTTVLVGLRFPSEIL